MLAVVTHHAAKGSVSVILSVLCMFVIIVIIFGGWNRPR